MVERDDRPGAADCVLAEVAVTARRWLLCADVLLMESCRADSVGHELAGLLSAYPGARVAVTRQPAGLWCAAGVRGRGVVLLLPRPGATVRRMAAIALGRALYHRSVWTDRGGQR